MDSSADMPNALFTRRLTLSPNTALNPKALPSTGGVYAFGDQHGRLIQMISAQNLRRSIIGRLEPREGDTSGRRADLRPITRFLWWTPTYSVFESKLTFLELARRLRPNDYRKELAFGPAWFASIQTNDRLPKWRVISVAFREGATDVGPFSTRVRCCEFVAMLEDLFDLCREYPILEQAPNGAPCAYFEMGKCPGPCDGSVSLEHYRRMIQASANFASGNHDQRFRELEAAMQQAATERAYARAGRIKETLSSARALVAKDRAARSTPQDFRYLIVQRGRTRTRVKAYVIDRGFLHESPSIPLKDMREVADTWLARARDPLPDDGSDTVKRSERIWLVSHFLSKGRQAPGTFIRSRNLTTPDNLIRVVAAKFEQSGETTSYKRSKQNSTIDPRA